MPGRRPCPAPCRLGCLSVTLVALLDAAAGSQTRLVFPDLLLCSEGRPSGDSLRKDAWQRPVSLPLLAFGVLSAVSNRKCHHWFLNKQQFASSLTSLRQTVVTEQCPRGARLPLSVQSGVLGRVVSCPGGCSVPVTAPGVSSVLKAQSGGKGGAGTPLTLIRKAGCCVLTADWLELGHVASHLALAGGPKVTQEGTSMSPSDDCQPDCACDVWFQPHAFLAA